MVKQLILGIEFGMSPPADRLVIENFKLGHLAKHRHRSMRFNCRAIVIVSLTYQDYSRNHECALSQGFNREQRVINGAEFVSGDNQYRQRQDAWNFDHLLMIVDRHQSPAGALNDPGALSGRMAQQRETHISYFDLRTSQLCRQVW